LLYQLHYPAEYQFLEQILATGEMCYVLAGKQFRGAVNLKQARVWMSVSRAVTQISTSKAAAFCHHMQDVRLIR
jgi:hypothetical protein